MTNKKTGPVGCGTGSQMIGRDLLQLTGIDRATGDPDTRDLAALLDQCAEHGLVVGRRCRVCRHPLTSRRSVLDGIGPRCAGGAQ